MAETRLIHHGFNGPLKYFRVSFKDCVVTTVTGKMPTLQEIESTITKDSPEEARVLFEWFVNQKLEGGYVYEDPPKPKPESIMLFFREGASDKFYESTLDGTMVRWRWGRRGTDGQKQEHQCHSTFAARQMHLDKLSEKRAKGYREAHQILGGMATKAQLDNLKNGFDDFKKDMGPTTKPKLAQQPPMVQQAIKYLESNGLTWGVEFGTDNAIMYAEHYRRAFNGDVSSKRFLQSRGIKGEWPNPWTKPALKQSQPSKPKQPAPAPMDVRPRRKFRFD